MRNNRLFILLGVAFAIPAVSTAQSLESTYTTEWQWDMNNKTNWVNMLRFDFDCSLWKNGTLEASSIHIARTNEHILPDLLTFSNIEERNNFAAIAKLGIQQNFKKATVFAGVRNINEDYFTSPVTSFFLNSSCGIFPTISINYPIANYPLTGLSIHAEAELKNWKIKSSLYNGTAYNGWNKADNPFLIRPKEDGIFNITEVSFNYDRGQYFVGTTLHSHPNHGYALFAYGEQTLWQNGKNQISAIAQYSENISDNSSCHRYAGVGGLYENHSIGDIGLFAQYAKFADNREWVGELSYRKELSNRLTLHPAVQLIDNHSGRFCVLLVRFSFNFRII